MMGGTCRDALLCCCVRVDGDLRNEPTGLARGPSGPTTIRAYIKIIWAISSGITRYSSVSSLFYHI